MVCAGAQSRKPARRGSRLRRLGVRPRRRPGEQVPRPPPAPPPSPFGAFLASPDTKARRSGGTRKAALPPHEKPQGGLKPSLEDTPQTFSWAFVSREAGFRVGWRRCIASLRRGRWRMCACTRIRLRPAERGRSPAPPPVSWSRDSAPSAPRLPSRLYVK